MFKALALFIVAAAQAGLLARAPDEGVLKAKLDRFVPACAGIVVGDLRLDACRDAERMIGHTPARATTFFLAQWSRVAFGVAARVEPDGIHLHPETSTGSGALPALRAAPVEPQEWTPTGNRAADVMGESASAASAFAWLAQQVSRDRAQVELKDEREIMVRALDRLYAEEPDDAYCRQMRAALAGVDLTQEASFETFLAADAAALGTTVEELTGAPR